MRARHGGSRARSDDSNTEWTCSCPDWKNRRTNCKHILFAISRILGLSIAGLGDADRRGRALADRILLIDHRVDDSDAAKKKIVWRLLGTRGCYNICFEPKNTPPVPALFAPPSITTPSRAESIAALTVNPTDTKLSSETKQDTKEVASTGTSNATSTSSDGTAITATTWPRTVDEALDLARRIVVSDRFRFTGGSEEAAATLANELRSSTGPRVPRYRRHPEEIDEDDDIEEDDETDWRPSSASSPAPSSTGRPPRRAASIRGEAAISAAAEDDVQAEDEKRASKPKKPAVEQKPYIGHPCPICLENFTESCEVVYCRRTCGNSSHVVCFARMAEFRRNTICPLCRAPMRIPTAKVKNESKKRKRNS